MTERFTQTLRRQSEPTWSAAVGHRFVSQLCDGSLPDPIMVRYLVQDHRFIDSFLTLLGAAIAAITAAICVRFLVQWLTRHGLAAFAYYRLALAAVLDWAQGRQVGFGHPEDHDAAVDVGLGEKSADPSARSRLLAAFVATPCTGPFMAAATQSAGSRPAPPGHASSACGAGARRSPAMVRHCANRPRRSWASRTR